MSTPRTSQNSCISLDSEDHGGECFYHLHCSVIHSFCESPGSENIENCIFLTRNMSSVVCCHSAHEKVYLQLVMNTDFFLNNRRRILCSDTSRGIESTRIQFDKLVLPAFCQQGLQSMHILKLVLKCHQES